MGARWFWLFVSVLLGALSVPADFPRWLREGTLVLAAIVFLLFVSALADTLNAATKKRASIHPLLENPKLIKGGAIGLTVVIMLIAAVPVHRLYDSRSLSPQSFPATPQPVDPAVLNAIRGLEKKLDEMRVANEPTTHASSGYAQTFSRVPLLYDRDPESWRGHRYGEPPLKLDETTRLEMPVGQWQRFNPQILSPEALFNVNIFVIIPRTLDVQEPKLWRISTWDNDTAQYWAQIGEVSPGIIQGINEALYIKAKTPGRFNVAYVVSGRGEQSGGLRPIKRVLTIEAE